MVTDGPLGRLHTPRIGEREETWPGVVFIHDVWGLTPHSEQFCETLAAHGFAVLELSLYRRIADPQITDPGRWIRELSDPEVLADVEAGVRWLTGQAVCAGRRVGVTGVCMGGMYALLAACGVAGLSAAAPFYGMLSYEHGMLHDEAGLDPARKPRSPLDAAADLGCPLLALFGEDDTFIPVDDVRRLERIVARSSHPAEVVVYPGAGHAFMNEPRAEAYRPAAAADAWARLSTFFTETLR